MGDEATTSGVFDRWLSLALGPSEDGVDRAALPALPHARELRPFGRVGWYESAKGRGAPIVLLHPIHAAAGSHDVRPLFERLRADGRRVIALDLPGFGLSDRGAAPYDAAWMAAAVRTFLREVVGGEPADLVAVGRSCELAARVATEEPALVRSLLLLGPSGFDDEKRPTLDEVHTRYTSLVRSFVGRALHFLATSTPVLEHQVVQALGVAHPELVADYRRTCRVVDAHHAPLASRAGLLHEADPFAIYERLALPTVVVHDGSPGRRFARLHELVRTHGNVRHIRVARCTDLVAYVHADPIAALILSRDEDLLRANGRAAA